MNKVSITKNKLTITISGLDKLLSLKGKLEIDRNKIKNAKIYDGILKPPFWRGPGTSIPKVIISGTYYGKNRKEFWNAHFKKGAIVLDLVDFEYTRIVIDTPDALKIVKELNG